MKKEGKGKGKWTIGPWMKNGRANPCSKIEYATLTVCLRS